MRFVVRRLGVFVVTLWAAVTLNFLIPRLMPGNAAIAMMARYKGRVNPQSFHALEIAFGVNSHQSLFHAYITYLGNIARGHFGTSLTFFPDTVAHQVLQALPWTLALVGTTTILAFLLGTFIGLVSACRPAAGLAGAPPPRFGVPVLRARAARDLALLDQARVVPRERRLRSDHDRRLELDVRIGRVQPLRAAGGDDPRDRDRRLDPDHAQQHDHGADRGLRAHG